MENGVILNNTYRILNPIGAGGVGEIYLGYHENLQKYVVIKKVKDHCTGLMNNRIEVDILKSLHHTYLPQVYDFIELEQGIFTVMDYISGYDLKYYMDNGYHFSEDQLLIWIKQLCQVLDYLHTRKPTIIHCDIKPGNIMITDEGNVCLIDFNISLDGENNKDLVGLSSFYASPEQIRKAEHKMKYGSGDQVKMDERTDIYSLGAVFYYLMSGCKPDTRNGYVYPLKNMELPYSEGFINIVDKAMAADSSKRFKSASKMLEALEHQEKWTIQYRKLWKWGLILDVSAACIAIVLIAAMWLGYRGMRSDQFYQEYETFTVDVNDWIEECNEDILSDEEVKSKAQELTETGIHILNERNYERLLKKNSGDKRDILFGVAQAYLQQDDYYEAEKYLEEILEMEMESEEVYRDLALIKARTGDTDEAIDMISLAENEGLDEAEVSLLRAEIAISQEDYEEAWEQVKKTVGCTDTSVAYKAASYVVEIGELRGNLEESIWILAEVADKSQGNMRDLWMRKQGELSLKLYEEGKKTYLTEAKTCFESIYMRGYAKKADLYNLAAVYTERNEFTRAERLLLDMRKDYPNEYKVPMYLAFTFYNSEGEKAASARNYYNMEKYYNEALKICKEQGIDVKSEMNLSQLEGLLEQLREQGWLK